jgi:hypothetical protein
MCAVYIPGDESHEIAPGCPCSDAIDDEDRYFTIRAGTPP